MSGALLFVGLVVLAVAFLSYERALLRRLGLLCVGLATFAAGYLLTGSVVAGLACASGWLLLPWLEILLRVRRLRLPLRRFLSQKAPPGRDAFPELAELSDEIEAAGFEHVADLGWETEGYRQFLRLFASPERRAEAAIAHVEHDGLGFHFTRITSRAAGGEIYMTWNCPVSQSLKIPPSVRLHRASAGRFGAMVDEHAQFLGRSGCAVDGVLAVDPDNVRASVEGDMEAQMRHNLTEGVLEAADDSHGRYSWRGMLFLWVQALRDIFRAF